MPKPPPKPVFDWMETRRSPGQAKTQANTEKARREAMYRAELEDRAALLQRLGYAKDKARARLAANLSWDFPDGKSPLDAGALDAIVDRLFNGTSGTPAGRPAPRGKGGTR
jgi:hypothetical protein